MAAAGPPLGSAPPSAARPRRAGRARRRFAAIGARIIRTPVQAPRANTIAERWICSVRRECTDRLLIVGRRHLDAVLGEYVHHYNTHRPHRALQQRPPNAPAEPKPSSDDVRILRRDRLGGLIHEYAQVA